MIEKIVRTHRQAIHPGLGKHPGFGLRTERREGLISERGVAVPIRGNLNLYADVFRPAGADAIPAIVCSAPFGKHPHIDLKTTFAGSDIPFEKLRPEATFEVFNPIRWAREGFAIRHWPLHNDGHHIIHAEGACDSHLLLPIVTQ